MIETVRGTVHEWQHDHMRHINVRACLEFIEHAAWQIHAALGLMMEA
jgi:acyl-CoA thioester hydrolase